MTNLKPYYDAALKADAEKQRILAEMDAHFNDGTEDGKKKALELRPALEEARLKAEESNALYVSMRDASLTHDNLGALFSAPADPGANTDQHGSDSKVMNRGAFRQLDANARMNYIKAGGTVVDQ